MYQSTNCIYLISLPRTFTVYISSSDRYIANIFLSNANTLPVATVSCLIRKLQVHCMFYSCLQTWEVTKALVVYVLGGIIHPGDSMNLQTVYEYTDKSTPVVLILPVDPNEPDADPSITGKILKVRLWVLMRDQTLTHLFVDISLTP